MKRINRYGCVGVCGRVRVRARAGACVNFVMTRDRIPVYVQWEYHIV